MATVGDQASLAFEARRIYTEELVKGLAPVVGLVGAWAVAPATEMTGAASGDDELGVGVKPVNTGGALKITFATTTTAVLSLRSSATALRS